MAVPKFCRVAIVVDDMDAFVAEAGTLLGLAFVKPALDELFEGFTVSFGEHGLMAIAVEADMPFARDGRLIEVAVDVADADATAAMLRQNGYAPVVSNHLPAPDATEYLFGRDFHGVPMMVCTAGDNEIQMREQGPFAALADAALPKVGGVTLAVADPAAFAAALELNFGMRFTSAESAWFGAPGRTGPHLLTLVDLPEAADAFEPPLAAIEIVYEDVEPVRQRLEAAGYKVLQQRALGGGHTAYYFGATIQSLPLAIYPRVAEAQLHGPASHPSGA